MISNISITPIKNMLKSALNIHNFSFKSHTSTAIIGANGSGKSTLINTILGIREDYNVKAQNNNIPYNNNIISQRKQLGVVSNLFNYPPGLNANDLFKFYQFFHKNCTPNLFEKNLLNKTYEHLSDGQKQRLKIDLALSHHPQLIIMDEPETSLEQNALIRLSNLISLRNTQQLTSIIATHDSAPCHRPPGAGRGARTAGAGRVHRQALRLQEEGWSKDRGPLRFKSAVRRPL